MIAAADNIHEAGIRKAAVLVASLDQAAADRLLDQLDPASADLVRQAVLALDEIDLEERQRVFDDFRRIGPMVPSQSPPGIELDGLAVPIGPTSSAATEDAPLGDTCDEGDSPVFAETKTGTVPDVLPFGFLRDAEEEKLWQLLSTERPQTIALVLSHLSPERAGEVLSLFAPARQVEVVRRLADLEKTDPETLREVEQALEARLSQQFVIEHDRATGPETVARILAACDTQVAGSILDNLAQFDQGLAEQLGRRPIAFDDLVQLDDGTLLAVFQAAEPEVVHAALLGASPPLVERILSRMIPEEAVALRCKLDCPGPIRLSDIEDAQEQIAALAQQMSRGKPSKTAEAA